MNFRRRTILAGAAALGAAAAFALPAQAVTVKVGLINTYSGRMASNGDQIQKAVDLYTKLHAKDLPPGVKIQIIKRDDTGINPETLSATWASPRACTGRRIARPCSICARSRPLATIRNLRSPIGMSWSYGPARWLCPHGATPAIPR